MTVSMTVRIFETEVDSRLLMLVGATIVVAAAVMMYFRDQESCVIPLWGIIATAVVAIVAVAGWHRWTRRRQMQRGDALGLDGGGSALGLSDLSDGGGSALGLSDLSDGGEAALRLSDLSDGGGSALRLSDGGEAALRLSDGGEAALRLSDRRSTRRDVDVDVDSLFNLSESFMTVQSFPKVRGYL